MEPVVSSNFISFDCPYCNGRGSIKKLLGFKKQTCPQCEGRKRIVKKGSIKYNRKEVNK